MINVFILIRFLVVEPVTYQDIWIEVWGLRFWLTWVKAGNFFRVPVLWMALDAGGRVYSVEEYWVEERAEVILWTVSEKRDKT